MCKCPGGMPSMIQAETCFLETGIGRSVGETWGGVERGDVGCINAFEACTTLLIIKQYYTLTQHYHTNTALHTTPTLKIFTTLTH